MKFMRNQFNNDMPEGMQFMKFDKYRDKSIRFYDKGQHYDLIFSGDFEQAAQQTPVYTDLLMDLKDADKSKQIHVWIHSCGGSCSTLMMISQQLKEFEYVVTIGMGQIDSAGFMLWCKGDERYLSPTTFCMYHSLSTGLSGKANQMKEYSVFIQKYQDIFQEDAKDILTKQQIEKGRYTQIWLLGKQLIQRGKALQFQKYNERTKVTPIQAFKVNDEIYLKNQSNKYVQVIEFGEQFTKKQFMKNHVFSLQRENEINENIQKFGQAFLMFMSSWFYNKENLFKSDGFVSDSFLMQEWNLFTDQKITVQELKDKIKQYLQVSNSNLMFQDQVKHKSKSGFKIQINK